MMKMFLFIFWLCTIFLFAAIAAIPNVMVIDNGQDKMIHMAVFCLLAIVPVMTFTDRRKIAAGIITVLAAGAGIEILQNFIPARQASAEDMMYNAAGVCLGLVIGYLFRAQYLRMFCHLHTEKYR